MNSNQESYLGRPGREALDFREDQITQTKTLQALGPALLAVSRHGLPIGGNRKKNPKDSRVDLHDVDSAARLV